VVELPIGAFFVQFHRCVRNRLAEQIRAKAGNLDAFYYAPTPDTGFVSAANLTPQHARNFMPLIFYTMLALVQEFLPHMLEQGDGQSCGRPGLGNAYRRPRTSRRPALDYARHEGTAGSHLSVVSRAVDHCSAIWRRS
jgi:hypothetical protein